LKIFSEERVVGNVDHSVVVDVARPIRRNQIDANLRNLCGPSGIVNLSGRGMLVVSVARRLGSENSFAPLKRSGSETGALGPLS